MSRECEKSLVEFGPCWNGKVKPRAGWFPIDVGWNEFHWGSFFYTVNPFDGYHVVGGDCTTISEKDFVLPL